MFDFAVIMTTVLRPSLIKACRTVMDQDVDGSINLMIGIDLAMGEPALLDQVRALARPPKRRVTIIDPGYSTSALRGGVFTCRSGGGLRSALSFLANARYLAFLDDDNWYAPNHLDSLARVIACKHWAFSLRHFVDSRTGEPLGVDQWESVGPGLGVYAKRFGGFCDTSTYMLDSQAAENVLPHWSYGVSIDGAGEDRRIFQELRQKPYGASGLATIFYALSHTDPNHLVRVRWLESIGAKPSHPMPLADAKARLKQRPSPIASAAGLAPTELEALRAPLIEARSQHVIVAGAFDPAVLSLLDAPGTEAKPKTEILDLNTIEGDPIETLSGLAAEEVLIDSSYVGALPLEQLEFMIAALWRMTRRTGAVIGLAATGAETGPQRAILERFAFTRATRLTWLGASGATHFHLARY